MVSDSFAFAFSYDTSPAGICILRGFCSPDRIGNPIRSGLCFCSCTVSVSVTRYADFHHSQR